MRLFHATIIAAAAVLLSLAGTVMAAEEDAPVESAPVPPQADVASFPYSPWSAARFGWWGFAYLRLQKRCRRVAGTGHLVAIF